MDAVSRRMVHKEAGAEVFLTGAAQVADDRFTVAVRWPGDHALYDPGPDGSNDLLLWAETVRQAGIYLSHRFYDVPMDHPFVLASVEFAVDDPRPPRPGPAPSAVTLDVTCGREAQGARRLVASAQAVIRVAGRRVGRVGLSWQAMDPARYALIRDRYRPGASAGTEAGTTTATTTGAVPLPPQAVDRGLVRDVMLAATRRESTWLLRLDTTHPVFFDHDCDHIPGMALLEALRQAAAVTAARVGGAGPAAPRIWTLRSGTIAFRAFGELDAPVTVTAVPDTGPAADGGELPLRIEAVQGGTTLVRADLRGLALSPGPAVNTLSAGGAR